MQLTRKNYATEIILCTVKRPMCNQRDQEARSGLYGQGSQDRLMEKLLRAEDKISERL